MLSSNMAVRLRRLTWISRGPFYQARVIIDSEINYNSDPLKIYLHKWILIAIATEGAMLEDSMTSYENTLYNRGSQSPARGACQSGPRDSAVFVNSIFVYISIDIALRSGPFGFHWNLIWPFWVSLESYPALRG